MALDTCVMQMFADSRDALRSRYGIRAGNIESSLRRNHERFMIPVAALGEVISKIRDKKRDRAPEALTEIIRLLDADVVAPLYIRNGYDTYNLAKEMSSSVRDGRDYISPMDALIIASAVTEPVCSAFVTSDKTLASDSKVFLIANEYREQYGYNQFKVKDIDEILKK